MPHDPSLVHYIPILTTLISAAFVVIIWRRAMKRGGWAKAPHLVWWAIGVFCYGLGTALESTITLHGNTPLLNKAWYWAGAILGGYPLATGSVYLLFRRTTAHVLTAASLGVVIIASVAVFLAPTDMGELLPHKPGGAAIGWQWVRYMTPFINLYAAVFLIGGALWSSVSFFLSGSNPRRAAGTALIALGALLPGIGGSLAKAGYVEALYIGEFVGLILIWLGYEVCVHAPPPVPAQAVPTETETAARTPEPHTELASASA